MKRYRFIIWAVLVCPGLWAQDSGYHGDPDLSFKTARELAFNGNRSQSQDTLKILLTKYPNYHDIRLFLGRTYSWDSQYKEARDLFSYVLDKDPERKDAWLATINNELWADQPIRALNLVNRALDRFPNDENFLYQKASAQVNGNNPEDALNTVKLILKQFPANQKAIQFENSLISQLSYNSVGIRTAYDFYSEVFDPMQYYAIKYSRQTKIGSIIGRLNFNRRFGENGMQFEIDAYPHIVKSVYAYMNLGFSESFLFPDLRYGAELYKSLPKSLEASLGFRALKYESGTTTIYTGSVGWYTGNNYFFVRSYVTPSDAGTSKSGSLNFRRYRSNSYNYYSLSLGIGFSPEINKFEYVQDQNAIIKLKSQKMHMGYYFKPSNKKSAWGAGLGITHQEISFRPGSYFLIYSVSLS